MNFDSGASYLAESDWSNVYVCFANIQRSVRVFSDSRGLSYRESRRWPMLCVGKYGFFSKQDVRLSLNRDYLVNGEVFFELYFVSLRRTFPFMRWEVRHNVLIASYKKEVVKNGDEVLRDMKIKVDELLLS